MDAVISDIHGNLEALDAVLRVIEQLGANRIICLGDVVCYGPDSLQCVRRSSAWDVLLAGDWDLAMIENRPELWCPTINRQIEWVRNQFLTASDSVDLLKTLSSYRRAFIENDCHFTHGAPDDVREYIFPEDVYCPSKLDRIAKQFDRVCVCGHSHIQGLYKQDSKLEWEFIDPVLGERYPLKREIKSIVTVGSVGQPRDEDPRAAFLTIDGDFFTFHRVEYEVSVTVDKIRSIPEIDIVNGKRLYYGR